MPRIVSKGSITGRKAYSNGGLGLSIGSGVGGARKAITRRAPDSGKSAEDNGGLSFVVNVLGGDITSYLGDNRGFYFIDATFITAGQSFGQSYSVFQNKDSVAIISEFADISGGFVLAVSTFAKYVTSNSFEITFPTISDIGTLTQTDISGLVLVYELSGNNLVLNNSLTGQQVLQAVNFTVRINLSDSPVLANVKSGLTFYSGKTFKYQLNTNDAGVLIYDGGLYPFIKITNSGSG